MNYPIVLLASLFLLAGGVPSAPPERGEADIRVLSMNLWQEGTSVPGGFDLIVDVIAASDADLVAMSEVRNYNGEDLHERLLAALEAKGERYHGRFAGGDVGLLSRWPITKAEVAAVEPDSESGPIIAYHLDLGAEGRLVVGVAHLDYKNYAVYLPRGYDGNSFQIIDEDQDGKPDPVRDLSALHRMDRASNRDEAIDDFLAYVEVGRLDRLPLILAGDFNEGSHLDWTSATKDLQGHNGVVIEWRNSRRLTKAGMVDSWRELFPDPVTHPGATWPSEAHGAGSTSWAPEVDERDRIDFVYYGGRRLRARAAWIVGSPRYFVRDTLTTPQTECPFTLSELPWPSDHKALLVDLDLQ